MSSRQLSENPRVLTLTSSFGPFSGSRSESGGGGGGVGIRRGGDGGDGGRTEPNRCGLGSTILGDKTGDLWADSTMEEGGGLGGRLSAIAVCGDMTVCW